MSAREGGISRNLTIPSCTASACQKEKVCAAFLTETSPKLYIYELVIHKLAAVGWQSLQRAMPGFAFSNERLTRKGCACKLGVAKSCPLKRPHAVGVHHALCLGKILQNPVGARNCCLLQIPWPQALILLYAIQTLLVPPAADF